MLVKIVKMPSHVSFHPLAGSELEAPPMGDRRFAAAIPILAT